MSAAKTGIWDIGIVRALTWTFLVLGVAIETHAQEEWTSRWGLGYNVDGSILSSPAVGLTGTNAANTIYVGVRGKTTNNDGVVAVPSSGTSRPRWFFRTYSHVDSSPAISADGSVVYFGCYDGRLIAVDAATGEKKWDYPTDLGIFSSPSISADGKTIYVGTADGWLYAVTSEGKLRWRFPAGDVVESAAVGPDGTVYFGSSDRNLYAVSPDGTEKWRRTTGGPIVSTPAIGLDGTIFITSKDQRLYAFGPDGQPRGTFLTNGDLIASPVLGADGTVYFGSGDRNFYAVTPFNGELKLKWTMLIGPTDFSTAAVRADGTIIFQAGDGNVRALDPNDGTTKWTYSIFEGGGDLVDSSPAIAEDGSIYIGSINQRLYSLYGNGSPLSAFSSWPMAMRDPCHSGRAVAETTGDARLLNIATRGRVGAGASLIAGFVLRGVSTKAYLLRGIGPTLAQFGVADFLPDPTLSLRATPSGEMLQFNDNWSSGPGNDVNSATNALAFPLPEGSKDSVIYGAFPIGAYTALVGTANGGAGVGLVEVYDALVNTPDTRIVNLSTRGQVGRGAEVLIPGFVIGGEGRLRVLIRAVGPGLTPFGVKGVLAQPLMRVFSGGTVIRTVSGWSGGGVKGDMLGAFAYAGAFPLQEGSADCAAVLTLDPGTYTVQVSGIGETTGEAIVEVYALP